MTRSTAPIVPPAGGHGGDGARVAAALGLSADDVLDLSASLNPVAPELSGIVTGHIGALGRYPDPLRATAALAEHLDVDRNRVLLTNGGAEAIALVGSVLGGTVDEPDFSLYPRTGSGPRWRSNPHSPSGTLDPYRDHSAPVGSPTALHGEVWDEAFWPLATGTWTRGDHRRGAVVVGSLTKLFACPGLRMGYLVVPGSDGPIDGERLLAEVRRRQPHWSVSGLVCEVLPGLLARADLPRWSSEVAELRDALVRDLTGFGLHPDAGQAPWVLVPNAVGLRERLAREAVVVRDCASFGLTDTVRIAVPDDEGRRRLVTALEATA